MPKDLPLPIQTVVAETSSKTLLPTSQLRKTPVAIPPSVTVGIATPPLCCGGRAIEEVEAARELIDHPNPPVSQRDFFLISDVARISRVDAWQHNGRLGKDLVTFLRLAVQDRGLDLVSRNNIANALELQEIPAPDLFSLFLAMADDSRESPSWRDYAVQHLASCARSAGDIGAVVSALTRIASDSSTHRCGTALVQLARLIQEMVIKEPDGFRDLLVQAFGDGRRDAFIRSTSLRLYGELLGEAALPLVRGYVRDTAPALRRVAIAFLGHHPCPENAELIRAARSDIDPSVIAAAETAWRRQSSGTTGSVVVPENGRPHSASQEKL